MVSSLRGSLSQLKQTQHLMQRMHLRQFSIDDVRFIISHGEIIESCGNINTYSIPCSPFARFSKDQRLWRLGGSVVMIDVNKYTIITVYDRFLDEIGQKNREIL